MSSATRYLCAAAYLAPSFANTVTSEIIGSHRAVAPSRGIDLVPIIRHCLQARRMQLIRDLQLIGLLLLGIVLTRGALVLLLIVAFFLSFLPGARWDRKSAGGRLIAGVASAAGLALVTGAAFVYFAISAAHSFGPALPSLGWGPLGILVGLAYWGVLAAVLFGYSRTMNRTLGDHLSHDAAAQPAARSSDRVENRITEVARAQYGNLTLYDGQNPFIDQRGKIPYSMADASAVTELIRNPQAGLRCYLRVSVSDEGSPVRAGALEVVGGTDQEVIVSAFVYVAVEGRMFYLQFVPASLAPILSYYHDIDRLPRLTSGKFLTKAAVDAMRTAFRDVLRAPFGVLSTLRAMWAEQRAFNDELTSASDYVYADIGARISVRELGASLLPRTYIQRLDTSKYTQMIERLAIETVLDFLGAKGADTAAYRARAEAIYNSGTIVAGNVRGTGIAVGRNAAASVSVS